MRWNFLLDRIAAVNEFRAVHIVTLPVTIETNPGEFIKAGQYVADNLLSAQLINLCGDGEMTPFKETRPFDPTKDWNGKKILLMRAGGFGDITNLTPLCRELKARWPKCEVHVASMKLYSSVLEHLPYIAGTIEYPVSRDVVNGFDAWVIYENAIERNPRAHEVPMVDLFAEIAGLERGTFLLAKDWTENKRPDYVVTKEESGWAGVAYPRKPGLRRICVQPIASGQCRVYPFKEMGEVIDKFAATKKWEVFLLGAHESIRMQETEFVHNMTATPMPFRQSCALVDSCDVLLGNDSALVHIAGALGVPAVALFGPFPWKLRTNYYPTVFALQGKGKCSPCFHHSPLGKLTNKPFPDKCPSKDKGFCEVLQTIKVDHIFAKCERVARPLKLQAL